MANGKSEIALLAAEFDALEQAVRLDEAEWWNSSEHKVHDKYARLAELRANSNQAKEQK